MDITAKIEKILKEKHFVILNNLFQYPKNNLIENLFNITKSNHFKLVCSFSATDLQRDKIIAGTLIIQEILKIQAQKNLKIDSIVPIGIFDTYFSFKQFIQAFKKEQKPILISQPILQRKIISRVNLKDSKKQLPKIQTPQINQQSTQSKLNKTQKTTKNLNIKPLVSSKVVNNQMKDQNNFVKPTIQKINIQKKSSDMYVKDQRNKKANLNIINNQSDSQDEKKILQQFNIQSNQKLDEKKIEIKAEKIQLQQNKSMIQQKQEIDDDEEYELFLKAQKTKTQNKNININIPNKIQKKTTQKTNPNPITTSKSNLNNQNKIPITSGQPNLFSFMHKK